MNVSITVILLCRAVTRRCFSCMVNVILC